MVKWMDVYKRLLQLYGVKTLPELGMAMGVPMAPGAGEGITDDAIPWGILERAVLEKDVSWDWLLAGRDPDPGESEKAPAGDGQSTGTDVQADDGTRPSADRRTNRPPGAPPRIETRELVRELLPGARDSGSRANRDAPDAFDSDGDEAAGETRRELRAIRSVMRREIEKVDRLLSDME